MIKLQIVRQKRAKFLEIAAVVSIEKLRIQRLDCLKQWVRCSSGLCVDGRKRCSNKSCKKQGLERSKARFHAGILSTGIRTWFYVRVDWIVPHLAGETAPLRRLQPPLRRQQQRSSPGRMPGPAPLTQWLGLRYNELRLMKDS